MLFGVCCERIWRKFLCWKFTGNVSVKFKCCRRNLLKENQQNVRTRQRMPKVLEKLEDETTKLLNVM